MKLIKKTTLLLAGIMITAMSTFAGNNDRAGQAGASELLINPWARGSGWGGVNIAGSKGVESMFLNVAGMALTRRPEIYFTHTNYLKGSDIRINAAGFSTGVGESGAIGVSLMAMDFGDIKMTTVDIPEGGIGYYTPQFFNLGLSYSKSFSKSIHGGATVRLISESIADAKASGVSFDAGIQYITGWNEEENNLRFGLTLKNVGSTLNYSGDGLSFRGDPPVLSNYQMTLEQRADRFELPSVMAIGAAYDWKLAENHILTVAGAFYSNSFTNDQFIFGLEYSFKKLFSLRGGYAYEKDAANEEDTFTASKGLSGGATVEIPLGKSGKRLGIDYSYRTTHFFDGTHSFGLRISL
ncbi:MAG: PorV/PorQ family protein [Bacteroidia bacterium]|nr:PorV/PorQ family protein [Bacteroidia bacterium]MCZ2276527.1 PorV/PorQ family protein [Bacteroidia bacterium]